MLKTIDLRQAERTAETEAFCKVIAARAKSRIGTDKFVASGEFKPEAPIRPALTTDDFTASGIGKPD